MSGSARPAIQKKLVLKSTRKFETFGMYFYQNNEAELNEVDFWCDGTFSPIFARLMLSIKDKETIDLINQSKKITHEGASRMLRSAREEQRYGGINHVEVRANTVRVVSSLVLAQLHPGHDFSFVNLEPHTIDTLKILAISHTDDSYTPIGNSSGSRELTVV